jgi:hypothetical protein
VVVLQQRLEKLVAADMPAFQIDQELAGLSFGEEV